MWGLNSARPEVLILLLVSHMMKDKLFNLPKSINTFVKEG